MKRLAAPAFALATAALLAGCTSSATGPDDLNPLLVTAPDDYAYLNQTNALSRPHLHDYWGGKDRITVLDQTKNGVFHYGAGDNWMQFMQFFPDEGKVVPQGTAYLEVRVEAIMAPGDHVEEIGLSYHAADSGENGDSQPFVDNTLTIISNESRNDLPHQVLSGWEFWFAARSSDFNRFTGTVHLTIDAVRGLPIPLFPGHPDQWNGTSQVQFVDRDDELYDVYSNGRVGQEMCIPVQPYDKPPELCPHDIEAIDGKLVPADASYVEVTMTMDGPSPGLTLGFHGGDTRQYTFLEPAETSGSTSIYRIEVNGKGDGPYAKDSLWAFYVRGAQGPDSVVEYGSYHITAIAYRDPPMQPVPYSGGAQESASDAPAAGTEKEVTITPATDMDIKIRSSGGPLRIRIEMDNGISRDATLTGPGKCSKQSTSTSIVAVSFNGNYVLDAKCGTIKAGTHTLHLEGGLSTFKGRIMLEGATFA